jgi:hypothetical protein
MPRPERVIGSLIALTAQNLEELTRTRMLTEEGLAEARRTREVAEQTALTRELLQVARATLDQVREINRKTVPAGAVVP